ncbi:MAG TPA: endonuclease VIII [Clostridiales bacterium]|nr:endonuclease VIII [Clostridiales bacterium]
MIELPESYTLARQLEKELKDKVVKSVVAGQSPHKFAWFHGDKDGYDERLRGKRVSGAAYYGGRVELTMQDDMRLEFHDGVNLRILSAGAKRPQKHQLLVEFTDGGALCASVQMYGGLMAYRQGEMDENPYYSVAREKPGLLSDGFDEAYFAGMLKQGDTGKLSAKAFLATEQRIPGVGNGVVQDVLWLAKINPRTKLMKLSDGGIERLFLVLKRTVKEMAERGGRDTEKDLYGCPGGYAAVMSKNNSAMVCPVCGQAVKKEAYLGGNVYYCVNCQPVLK